MKFSKEHCLKISKANKGRVSPNKGNKFSPETCQKISIGKTGIKNTEEQKKRKSEALKGRPNPMKGKKFTKKHCQNMSKSRKGKIRVLKEIRICPTCNKEFKIRKTIPKKYCCCKCVKRTKYSPESKLKMRIAKIKLIEQNYGICYPTYNRTACEFFKSFDEENNTKGQYALYGGGEFQIKELGYFVDYINFEKKLIMEWDEKHHKYQKEKDLQRQQEIQNLYPEFEFKRIKEFGHM